MNYQDLAKHFGVPSIGQIRFAHAVNSRSLLEKCLRDPSINILEGDISVSEDGEIIMAHPPATASDLKFTDWLTRAVENRKGVKPDFKTPEVVEPCLKELNKLKIGQLPIFLNADVLKGPGGDSSNFDPEWFIKTCSDSLPKAILSLGWETECVIDARYTSANVSEMLELLTDYLSPKTFPVNAFYIKDSWKNLIRLLERPDFSLTLWNNKAVDPDLLEWIKENTDPTRTFYDLINPDGSSLPI